MEPIKFEDNIREKLQERELAPSNKSWEKLAKQLETSKTNKSSNKSFWFAIAAGFIGIVIVTSFLFKDEVLPTQFTPELVEETNQNDVIIPVENNEAIVISSEKPSKEVISELPIEKTNKTSPTKQGNVIAVNVEKTDNSLKKEQVKDAIATIDKSESKIVLETNNDEVFINSKVEEVIAQVQALQKSDNSVSAEEINYLLLKAQSEIHSRKIINSINRKVDATALLNVVESELETSFRDKVFEALGDGFEKVRTAVVERNN